MKPVRNFVGFILKARYKAIKKMIYKGFITEDFVYKLTRKSMNGVC